jgi:hypothetical protein
LRHADVRWECLELEADRKWLADRQNDANDPKRSFDAGPVTPMLIRPRRLRFDPAQAVVRSNLQPGFGFANAAAGADGGNEVVNDDRRATNGRCLPCHLGFRRRRRFRTRCFHVDPSFHLHPN